MTLCIYCGREAIQVTSFTTGCCRDARKVWALEQINEVEESLSVTVHPYESEVDTIRQTLLDVNAPRDNELEGGVTSIHRQIRLLACQRDQAQTELKEAKDAIDFAVTDDAPLPVRIKALCASLRNVIQQRDQYRSEAQENPKAKRLLEMFRLLANSSREGWEKVCALHEHFGRDDDIYTILHHSQARPPGWHGG